MKEQHSDKPTRTPKRAGLSSLALVLPLVFLSLLFRTIEGQAKPVSGLTKDRSLVVVCDECVTNDVTVYEQTENLVPNPNFEKEIESDEWVSRGNCSFKQAKGDGRNGSYAAKIYGTSSDYCEWKTFVPAIEVSPDKYYDFAGWIKTDFPPGATLAEARIAVRFWDASQDPIGGSYCHNLVNESEGWKRLTGRVRAPENAAYARVYLGIDYAQGGIVWFDEVFMGLSVNLAIDKDDDPDPVGLGAVLTYTLPYSNVGCEQALAVFVRDKLDDYTTYITSTTSGEWCTYDASKHEVICYDASLDVGKIEAVTVTVEVSDTTGGGSYLVNEATIESLETEVDFVDIEITHIPTNGCKVQLTDPQPLPREFFPDTVHYPYQYWVLNKGNYTGTVTLTAQCSLGWPVMPYPIMTATYPVTVTLSPGCSVFTGSAVIVSNEWFSGTQCPVGITATLTCPGVSETDVDTKTITTTARRVGDVVLSPGTSKRAEKGIPVSFSHTITNGGNWTDTLYTSCDFDPRLVTCVSMPVSATLAKQESISVTVTLTDAGCGVYMPMTIAVTSTGGALDWHNDALTAHYTPTLSPGTPQDVNPDTTVSLTHILAVQSNLGHCQDTFTIAAESSRDWVVPGPSFTVPLALSPTTITVPVYVSSEFDIGGRATITVTANSHFSPVIQSVITNTLTARHLYEVYLPLAFRNYPPSPDLRTSEKTISWGLDGSQVMLTFATSLTNTGVLTAVDLVLVDAIPDGTTFKQGSITSDPALNCEYHSAKDEIECDGSLGIGESANASFKAELNQDNVCFVTNTALVDDGFHPPFPLEATITLVPPLPLILNGTFGSGYLSPCWTAHGLAEVVPPAPVPDSYNCFSSSVARLGRSGYNGSGLPEGMVGWVAQPVTVTAAASKLQFSYCIYSNDVIKHCETGAWYDTFEVAVGDLNNPLLRKGSPHCRAGTPWESGLVTRTIDLGAYQGQSVTLYFSVWNRRASRFNTWVYIDNIRFVP